MSDFVKVDQKLGVVFGWALTCTRDGVPIFDTQGDHVPEDAMLRAAAEFMSGERTSKTMHAGPATGRVVFAFPATSELTKALGLSSRMTGLIVGIKPDDQSVLAKFLDGTYSGFSIGGVRISDEVTQ